MPTHLTLCTVFVLSLMVSPACMESKSIETVPEDSNAGLAFKQQHQTKSSPGRQTPQATPQKVVPRTGPALERAAQSCAHQKKPDKAFCDEVIRHLRKAATHAYFTAKIKSAKRQCNHVLTLDSKDIACHRIKAMIYEREGKVDEACDAYSQAIRYGAKNSNTLRKRMDKLGCDALSKQGS